MSHEAALPFELSLVVCDAWCTASLVQLVAEVSPKIRRYRQSIARRFFSRLLNELNRAAGISDVPFGFIDKGLRGHQPDKRFSGSSIQNDAYIEVGPVFMPHAKGVALRQPHVIYCGIGYAQ